jgi:hypothetical protein
MPAAPLVMVSHDCELVAVHEHVAAALTSASFAPPRNVNDR